MIEPRPIAAIRLDGGRLCVDFVNTIHDRAAPVPEDYLATPERYVEWALRTGAIRAEDGVRAPASAGERAELMAEVGALREAVYRLLVAWLEGVAPPADALEIVNGWLQRARRDQALADDGQLVLRVRPGDVHRPLKRIALDLVETLDKARAGAFRLGCCANHAACGWLFADTSKNGRRRWCAMETCGTISKMATLRERRRQGARSAASP